MIVIIGKGKVGTATASKLDTEILWHDPYKGHEVDPGDLAYAEYVFVCVDTLQRGPDDHRDISRVLTWIHSTGYRGDVVIRSTIHPGWLQQFIEWYDFNIVMFPEFMVQRGDVINDNPWNVVIGSKDPDTAFAQWLVGHGYCADTVPINVMTPMEACITKLGANALLATKVTAFNALHEVCMTVDADFDTVRSAIVTDTRIGAGHSLVPSPDDGQFGFGGHCLPKDIKALAQVDPLGFFATVNTINQSFGRN